MQRGCTFLELPSNPYITDVYTELISVKIWNFSRGLAVLFAANFKLGNSTWQKMFPEGYLFIESVSLTINQ